MRMLYGMFEAVPAHPLVPENQGFDLPEQVVRQVSVAVRLNRPVLLYGELGAGKTSLVSEMAARLQIPMVIISCTADDRPAKYLGGRQLQPGPAGGTVTVNIDGPLKAAVRHGYWVVLDEMPVLPGAVLSAIHGLLETDPHQRKLIHEGHLIEQADGTTGPEVLEPHPRFRLFATGNAVGKLSHRATAYQGNRRQNTASIERWTMVEMTHAFSAATLKGIFCPQLSGDQKRVFEHIADVIAGPVQMNWEESFRQRRLPYPLSLRTVKSFCARFMADPISRQAALKVTVINQLPQRYADTARAIWEDAFGQLLK